MAPKYTPAQESAYHGGNLFLLSGRWTSLLEEIDASDGVLTDEQTEKYEALVELTDESIDAACIAWRQLEAQQEHLANEAKRIAARKASLGLHCERIRAALFVAVQRNGGKYKTPTNTLFVNVGRTSVDLMNGFKVPPELAKVVEPQLDKAKAAEILYAVPTEAEISELCAVTGCNETEAERLLREQIAAKAAALGIYERPAVPFLGRR